MAALAWDNFTQERQTSGADQQEITRARSLVLSYLVKLNKSINAHHTDLVQALLQRFNETLIDYVSYGHFRLFRKRNAPDYHLAALHKITEQIIEFNDRYVPPHQTRNVSLSTLRRDLEQLALALEARFDIEDQVIADQSS